MNFSRSTPTLRPVNPSPLTRSAFPADAQATIYKTTPSPMTSGRTRAERWTLRFERRSAPYIEPLMGWTGDDDTLAQVELSFPSAETVIAYARRQGLQYTVQGLPARGSKPPDVDNALSTTRKRDILRQWALDAYRIESEHAKPDNRSHLHEMIDALLDLEEPQISVTSFSHSIEKQADDPVVPLLSTPSLLSRASRRSVSTLPL